MRTLLELSQARPAGEYLGAEEELLAKIGISRPTLRQAAKVLENDGMLAVRRGQKGGYYAARPEIKDILGSVVRYLRLQGATIEDAYAATNAINEDIAAAAARCIDESLRNQLMIFRNRIDEQQTHADIIRGEVELMHLLGMMCGNVAAQMFVEISYALGLESQRTHFYQADADRQQAKALQRGLCDAVLAGDVEVARLMSQRRSAIIGEWMKRENEIRQATIE